MHLQDFSDLSQRCRDWGGGGLEEFLAADPIQSLAWPEDVVEQWLYDFAAHGPFLVDYGHLDLTTIRWHDEQIPAAAFLTMPTGPSDAGLIDYVADNPDHWSEVRRLQGVPQHWESHGTWLRRPLLLDRTLLDPSTSGLQVIEGRTRVGVLRGFLRRGDPVASHHAAWVARPNGGEPGLAGGPML